MCNWLRPERDLIGDWNMSTDRSTCPVFPYCQCVELMNETTLPEIWISSRLESCEWKRNIYWLYNTNWLNSTLVDLIKAKHTLTLTTHFIHSFIYLDIYLDIYLVQQLTLLNKLAFVADPLMQLRMLSHRQFSLKLSTAHINSCSCEGCRVDQEVHCGTNPKATCRGYIVGQWHE